MWAHNLLFSKPAQCLAGHGNPIVFVRQAITSNRALFHRFNSTVRQSKKLSAKTRERFSEETQIWNPTIRNLAGRQTPTLLFQGRSRFPDLLMRFSVGSMCYCYAAFHTYTSILHPPEGFHPILRRMMQVIVIVMAIAGSWIIFRRIRGVRSITAIPRTISGSGQRQPLTLQIRISRIIPYGPKVITVPCRDVTLTQPLYVSSQSHNDGRAEPAGTLSLFTLPFRLLGNGIQGFYKEFQNLFWQQDNPLIIVKGFTGAFNLDADSKSFALDNGARLNEIVRKSIA